MPIYEYVCDECKARFERIVTAKNGKSECPKCGSNHATIQFSTFAARTGNNSSANSTDSETSSSACGCTPHSCDCH